MRGEEEADNSRYRDDTIERGKQRTRGYSFLYSPSGFYTVNGRFEPCVQARRVRMHVCIGYIQPLWKRKVQRYCRGGHEWTKEWKVETSVPIHNVGNARNPE